MSSAVRSPAIAPWMPPWLPSPEVLAEPLVPLGAIGVALGSAAALGVTGVRGIGKPLPSTAADSAATVSDPAPSVVLTAVTDWTPVATVPATPASVPPTDPTADPARLLGVSAVPRGALRSAGPGMFATGAGPFVPVAAADAVGTVMAEATALVATTSDREPAVPAVPAA